MKPYKPNYLLYILLSSCLIILRIYLLSFTPTDFINIIGDFATGGLASTLVAFMIDLSTSRKKNQEIAMNRASAYRLVYISIITSLRLFATVCKICLSNDENKNLKLNFEEWLETYKSRVAIVEAARKDEIVRFLVDQAIMEYELTRKEICKMLDARFLLQVNSLMNENAYFALHELDSELSSTQTLLKYSQDVQEKETHIINMSTWMFEWVKSNSEISRFCDIKFSPMDLFDPTLYCKIFSKEYFIE